MSTVPQLNLRIVFNDYTPEIYDMLLWRFQGNGLPMLQEDRNNTYPRDDLVAGGLSTGLALVV